MDEKEQLKLMNIILYIILLIIVFLIFQKMLVNHCF